MQSKSIQTAPTLAQQENHTDTPNTVSVHPLQHLKNAGVRFDNIEIPDTPLDKQIKQGDWLVYSVDYDELNKRDKPEN